VTAPIDNAPSGPIRVLVCDDAADVRALFRIELELDGDIAVVALASSGEEAIELGRRLRPAVALIDLGLPARSGLETLDELLAERLAGAVVVVSGSADAAAESEAVRRGAIAFVGKRTPAAELRDAVRSAARTIQAGTARRR
jgi:DNA-binding NarL/FixJ family response regulator